MSKNAIKLLQISTGAGKFDQVESKDQASRLSKVIGFTPEQTSILWKEVLDGKDHEVNPDADKKENARIKKAITNLKNILKVHNEEMTAIADRAKEDEKRKEQKVKEWNISLGKGEAIAVEYTNTGVTALQTLLGDKFVAGVTGLKVRSDKGVITEDDILTSFKTLLGSHEGLKKVEATIGWELGDLINFTYEKFGDSAATDMITHATALAGRSKHTVQESQRLCNFLKEEDDHRRANLPWTHHQKILNNKGFLEKLCSTDPSKKDAPLKEGAMKQVITAILDFAVDGPVESTHVDSKGNKVEFKKHRTVKEIDEFIKKLDPEYKKEEKKEEKKDKEEKEEKGAQSTEKKANSLVIYFMADTATFYVSDKIHQKACSAQDNGAGIFYVIDTMSLKEIASDGSELATIEQLPTEYRDDIEVKAEEVKKKEVSDEEVPG